MTEEIPKLDLLIKMMKMTNAEDAMALVAIRKANAVLAANGWDWEKVLKGKVTIIADPFGATPVMAKAKPAAMNNYTSPPPPPSYAPNPFPGGVKPKPKPAPAQPAPKPAPQPFKMPQAPAGPLHFRRASTGEWAIASHINLASSVGMKVDLEKRDGTKTQETVGPFIEQNDQGYYLYKIAKASKWKAKYADQTGIADLI